jgi:hypothetical protein
MRPTMQLGNFDPITSIPDVPSYPNTRPVSLVRTSRSSSSLSLPSLDYSNSRSSSMTDDTTSRPPGLASVPNHEAAKCNGSRKHTSPSSITRVASWIASSETPTLDNALLAESIVPVEKLNRLGERTRAMNLYHSFIAVLGCREAMWEELRMLQRSRRHTLVEFGWESRVLHDKEARSIFDELFERFKS